MLNDGGQNLAFIFSAFSETRAERRTCPQVPGPALCLHPQSSVASLCGVHSPCPKPVDYLTISTIIMVEIVWRLAHVHLAGSGSEDPIE